MTPRQSRGKRDGNERGSEGSGKRRGKIKSLPHNEPDNAPADKAPELSLEQEIEHHKLEDDSKCPDCGGEEGFSPINSSEESGEIEVVERRYIFKRHQRQKYHCKSCQSIITAPGGTKLTPGGEFSIQIATQVAGDKFEDHIPLNRQQRQMAREGLTVGTRTLFWTYGASV